MTPNEKIEEINKDIKDLQKEISEIQRSKEKSDDECHEISERINDLEVELQKERVSLKNARMMSQTHKYKLQNQATLLEGKKQILKETERDIAIHDLVSKQQKFWDALEARIKSKGSDINSGLHGLGESKDPATAIKAMKAVIDAKMSFSQTATKIRGTCSQYDEHIKNMCSLAVDGKNISPDHKTQRFLILDRFLEDRAIQAYWM